MDPTPAPFADLASGDSMPAELLAAFVEIMLESSQRSVTRDDAAVTHH